MPSIRAASEHFDLATPSGVISTTGVGGRTLGGGHGYLTRKLGLTVDNLLEADVVLADGSFVKANEDEHPDLSWALRGEVGSFGAVTSFKFALHLDTVYGGPMLWTIDKAREVLEWYRDFSPQAPRDLYGFFAFMRVPPVEEFPESLHGQNVCGILWCYAGELEKAEDVFEPIRNRFGNPDFDMVGPIPYPTLRYRDVHWSMVIAGVDPDPSKQAEITNWAREYWEAIHPHSVGGSYQNFMMEEGPERVRATYGENFERLKRIKAKYDSDNFFRVNQNIEPS